jgi:hypothetical protein
MGVKVEKSAEPKKGQKVVDTESLFGQIFTKALQILIN